MSILCGFCNAPWTESMEVQLHRLNEGCDSCGYGSFAEVSIEIRCESCKRAIYKKEGIRVE